MTDATSSPEARTAHKNSSFNLRSSVTDAINKAVLEEMATVGYGRLSMDGVARRAGSSKQSLYRRWTSKEEMVISVLQTIIVPPSPQNPTSDDFRRDVYDAVRATFAWMSHPLIRQVLPDLIAEGMRNNTFADLLTTQLSIPRRQVARKTLQANREISDIDEFELNFVLDLIAAPFFWRLCGQREEIDDRYIETVSELIYTRLARVSA